jgi:hypothetical protein
MCSCVFQLRNHCVLHWGVSFRNNGLGDQRVVLYFWCDAQSHIIIIVNFCVDQFDPDQAS